VFSIVTAAAGPKAARAARTPARKKAPRRSALGDDDEEQEWEDAQESEEEAPSREERSDDDEDDDDAVPESPSGAHAGRRAAAGAGALVRLPPQRRGALPRLRSPAPQNTPSVGGALRTQTPHAPPRWRLKNTVRVPTEVRAMHASCSAAHARVLCCLA
jgi:hypothetical protein